ncbi:MAG: CAP domain-containing protein [Holophaga sp.]|nr:CAP domain-containing protein [Holophaga sp.]
MTESRTLRTTLIRSLAAAALAVTSLCAQQPVQASAPRSTAEEQAVVREITKIRMFPREYAKYLRALGTRFEGTLWRLRDHIPIRTNEGRRAVLEAAEFLEQVKPIPGEVIFSEGLHVAAWEHVADQGPSGQTGHVGVSGSTFGERIRRYGEPGSLIGEVINYGRETPRMTVIQLVIDDGVPDRGHRKNLFNPDFRTAGAAIGQHKGYGTMTVVDLADSFTPKP